MPRFVTYNVLTPHYATPDIYTDCDPTVLGPRTRLNAIKNELLEQIAEKAIIALQEVCQEWADDLRVFFEGKSYSFIVSNYGVPASGYMGVAIAYPRATYQLKDCQIVRVADLIPSATNSEPACHRWSRSLSGVVHTLTAGRVRLPSPEPCAVEIAKKRYNRAIALTLSDESIGATWSVVTYHMPCAFRTPDVMRLHFRALVSMLHFDNPTVLLGDFNLRPGDPILGEVPKGYRDVHKNYLLAPLPYTNYSRTAWGGETAFCDVLDYIYASAGVKVKGVSAVPSVEEMGETMPNREHPSDHHMIYADLE